MVSDNITSAEIDKGERLFRYLIWVFILLGILLRIVVYLQNNSMYEDEADVARNIFERSFYTLTQPLAYYQYAPPIFLWVVKLSTLIGGYGEYAYRIFPLVCGILSMVLFYDVLKYYCRLKGQWYVLLLLAAGPIYIHYGTVTKQYVPDMFISLILIWLALRNDLNVKSGFQLFVTWVIAGSIAIWSSMPSVFILAGIGIYYFYGIIKYRKTSKFWFLMVVGVIWLGQFGFYYLSILRPQANSQYLQNFHKAYFFYVPNTWKIFSEDIDLFFSVIATAGGHLVLAMVVNVLCIIIGIVYLRHKNIGRLILLGFPLILLLFAACLHQYTLIPRVILFAMPLLLVLVAVGFEQLLSYGPSLYRFGVIILAVINIVNFNAFKNFVYPMEQEEMKQSLDFLNLQKIKGPQLYVEQLAVPAYVYYTDINPEKERWASLHGANTLQWGVNFDSLSRTFPSTAAMLYSWDEDEKIKAQQAAIRSNVTLVDSNIVKGGRVYIYSRK